MQRLLAILSGAAIGNSAPILSGFNAAPIVSDDGTVVEVDAAPQPEYAPNKASPITNELPRMQYSDQDDDTSVAPSAELIKVVIVIASGKMLLGPDHQETIPLALSQTDGTQQRWRLHSIFTHQSYLPVFVLAVAIGAAGTVYFVLRYGRDYPHS